MRRRCKVIVLKYIRKNYVNRIYNADKIKRSLRTLMNHLILARKIDKKRKLKVFAYDCVIKCNAMIEKRAEKKEILEMHESDAFSTALRDYVTIDNYDNIDKSPENDSLSHNSDNSNPATSAANSPSTKSYRNERAANVHDHWSSIFENTNGIDMGLNNLKKYHSPVQKSGIVTYEIIISQLFTIIISRRNFLC